MKETQYIAKIMNKLVLVAGNDLYYHKVADAGSLQYSQPRAVDVLASYQGLFIGMEWKLHKTTGAFALSRFRESQYIELAKIEKSDARALVVIGVYSDKGKHQEIYIVPFSRWINLIIDFKTGYQPLKSIKLQDRQFDPYRITLSKIIGCNLATQILNRIVGTVGK
jgi:penicillin-binding protein-related factor A (putative recombinase)